MGSVVSVSGAVDPQQLGVTHSHEHILWDYFDMVRSYDAIFDEVAVAERELARFAAAGGGTLVDCSAEGIGPRPNDLRELSERTGVTIVLGCGWYRECVYPERIARTSTEDLAAELERILTQGFPGTDVRAGFIGEIGTERGWITPAEERVFRAAARAALRTGSAIITHTTHFGELALEQIALLTSEGVSPDRIVVSHLGDREDLAPLLEIADTGVYLSIDNIGYEGDGYPSDRTRARNVKALVERGHTDRVVLGTDVATRSALHEYGGRGYGWLLQDFVPHLLDIGVDQGAIDTMLRENMGRVLARPVSSDHGKSR